MAADLVIKVNYGETFRRFGLSVNEKGTLDMGMSGLVSKILDLFKLPMNADVLLTYVDEDNDIVTLVDDNDLHEAIRQFLNPLRINVQLNPVKDGKFDESSSHINSGVSELLKSLPEPLSNALVKLSLDLASKAVSSAPVLTGLGPLDPGSKSQSGMKSCSQGNFHSSLDSKVTKVSEASQKLVSSSEVLPHTESYGQAEANTRGVGTSISPSASLGEWVDYPKYQLRHIPVNNLVASVLASNDLSRDEGKMHLKKHDVPLKKPSMTDPSSSWADSLLHYPDVTHVGDAVPPTSIFAQRGLTFSGGDKAEIIPVCSGHSSASHADFYSQIYHPFSGMTPGDYRVSHPFKRSYSGCSGMDMVFHNIQCYGCGVYPITGPRFKSKVKDGCDLCSKCFSEMGTVSEYTRMNHPTSIRSPRNFRMYNPTEHSGQENRVYDSVKPVVADEHQKTQDFEFPRNEYKLEQSINDLCGVSHWDSDLEELQMMGYDDKETIKKLWVKNKGIFQFIVMDLEAGVKA